MPCSMLSAWLLLALASANLSDPDKGMSGEKEQALASPYAQLITSHFQLIHYSCYNIVYFCIEYSES